MGSAKKTPSIPVRYKQMHDLRFAVLPFLIVIVVLSSGCSNQLSVDSN